MNVNALEQKDLIRRLAAAYRIVLIQSNRERTFDNARKERAPTIRIRRSGINREHRIRSESGE